MRIIAITLLSMGLAACASVPLRTVYNLWNFDPWTSDFRVWRAAVRLPERREIDLRAAQIKMKIETWTEGQSQRAAELFVLQPSQAPEDVSPLKAQMRPGFALGAFRFDPNDYVRLEALRARIATARRAPGPKLHGALSISASACNADVAALSDAKVLLSTYLMVDPKDGYNTLVSDYDIAPELKKSGANPDGACKNR